MGKRVGDDKAPLWQFATQVFTQVLAAGVLFALSAFWTNFWAGLIILLPLLCSLALPTWRQCWSLKIIWRSWSVRLWVCLTALLLALCMGIWGFDALDRQAITKGYDIPQRNWLGLSAGVQDSVVHFAPKFKTGETVAVLLLDEAELKSSLAQRRSYLVDVLELIRDELDGVMGVALDLVFDEMVDLEGKIDAKLCDVVKSIRNRDIGVVTGHVFDDDMSRKPLVDTVHVSSNEDGTGCFTVEEQGHLAGFFQVDQVLRFVPQYLRSAEDRALPSLSMRAAQLYAASDRQNHYKGPKKLHGGVVWLYAWEDNLARVKMHEIEEKKQRLYDRVLFVGFPDAEHDQWTTPVGNLYGVEVHAVATDALIQDRSIKGTPNWANVVGILVQGIYLSLLIFSGAPVRNVLGWIVVVCITSIGAGIGAMAFSGIWLDIPFMPLSVVLIGLVGVFVRRLKWFESIGKS